MNWPHLQLSRLRPVARKGAVLLFAFAFVALIAATDFRADRRLEAHAAQGNQEIPRDSVRELAPSSNSRPSTSRDDRYARLAERAAREGTVRVIVGLDIEAQPEARLSGAAISGQRLRIAQTQASLLSRISARTLRGLKQYSFIPYLALEVDAAGLELLRNAPEQRSIEEDGMRYTSLAESVPLIGAPNAWANGFSGSGQAVAILDTGVSKTHPFLTGKVVSEACYSTNSFQTSSVCPGGVSQSTASGSGVNCGLGGCDHGTHVAGIAAGTSVSFSGVAKDANVIAIQVFSGINGCAGSNCVTAFDSDIILGLQRVQQLSGSLNIAAVNLSLGGSGSGRTCDATASAFKAAVDSLRALGIATVVASGNNASNGGMSFPACISSTVSVGSTGDGSHGSITDFVSNYSNSASFLNLLAPGEMINSSIPGNAFAIYRGTSMATPHVTGAWAVLKSKTPAASVPQVLLALTNTGVPIIDARNGVSKPRINVGAAATALQSSACGYSITPGSQSFGQSGGADVVSVIADPGCSWTAVSNVPWIGVTSGSNGIGNGNVNLQIGANLGVEREGTVLIAGQKYIISQTGITTILVDDGSFENASGLQLGGTSYRVNRLTPSSYPATISAVAIYFPGYTGVHVGDSFNVIYGSNPGGGSNIDGISLSFVSATVQTLDQFNIYPIPQQTINSGDFVVGMQYTNASGVLPFAIDTTAPSQGRSYRSTNGTNFTLIDSIGTPGNYSIRAIPLQVVACPLVTDINPTSGFAGSSVAISGSNFSGVTSIRFSNGVNAPFSITNDELITTTVPPGSVPGPITLSKFGCTDVQTSSFNVIACPTISGLSSSSGSIGSSLTITGTNLTGVTAVTFSNGVAASFTVNSATEITTTVPAGAVTGTISLSKSGCSDVQSAVFTIVTCPAVSGISPASGLIGSSVIISGSNFTGVTAVKFSNNVSASFTIDNNNQITATVPVGAVTGPITLTRPGCGDVLTTSFTVIPCPSVSGISPGSGLIGSSVIIIGSSFTGVTAVKFSNNVSASFTIDNNNQITTTVPVGAVTGPITLTRPGCGDVLTTSFTVIPCPSVSGISPGSGLIGSSVIIIGSSFTGVTAVKFSNNVSASFTIDNNNQITATVPTGAVTGPITLTRPGCGDVLTTSFTVIPCASVSGISPGSGLIGSSVIISGSSFTGVTAVKFSNNVSASFTIDNNNQITATVPTGAVTGPITLTRPGCGDVLTTSFTVIPCPSVSGISPGSGLIGSSVIISGSSFTGVTAVKFSNNVSASFTIDNNNQITTTVPVGAVTGPITLTRPGCGDVLTTAFTVIPCPSVSGISPGSGLIGSSVIIIGSSFTGVTAVKFSNNVSASFTIDNNNQITATVPVGAVTGPITLIRPGCGDVLTTSFTVIPCPSVSGISPGSGLIGSSVIISGSSFTGVTAVKFSNNVSASFTIDNNNQITTTVPAGAVSGPITLTRPGCSDVQTTSFAIIPCPTIGGLLPSSGVVGSSVIISGNDLTGVTAVRFSNNITATFSIDSQTQITATVPAGAVSGPVTLVRPGCGEIQSSEFTVISCPTILFMSPGSGMVGTSVSFFGLNFDGVTSVKFANNVSAAFTINSSSQITATVPAGASSGAITISKPGCGDVQTSSFTVTPPCSYSLSASVRNFSAKAATGSVDITAAPACGWSVSGVPSWVHLTAGSSGAGSGTVTFSVDLNPSVVRTAVMTIAGQSFTVRQGANFLDVSQDDIFYDFIGKLSAAGVTAGCNANGPLYCPGSAVTREQMAAFIIRALGNFNPPTPTSQRFVDVPPANVFYAFVEQMAVQGITLGCSADGPQYCPSGAVTREQMAAFLIRALGDFNPPTPTSERFVDVGPTNPFYAFIEQMALRGITLGCDANGPLYCPSGQVTRGQMAAFLVRAFGL